MCGSYHASAEGHRTVNRETSFLGYGTMMRKDLSVQQEFEREVLRLGLRRNSSAEDDMRDAISVAEHV